MSDPGSPSLYLNLPPSPSPSPAPSPSPSLAPRLFRFSTFSPSFSPRDRPQLSSGSLPLPKKVKITIDLLEQERDRFKRISTRLSVNQEQAFVTLLNKFEEVPGSIPIAEGEIRKRLFGFQTQYPELRNLQKKTSELKNSRDREQRRKDTNLLLTSSLEKINGGEWLEPMTHFFKTHPDRFDLLLKEMQVKENTLKENFPASLLDFIQLLDEANGSINVLGLRRIHKLLVCFFSLLEKQNQ